MLSSWPCSLRLRTRGTFRKEPGSEATCFIPRISPFFKPFYMVDNVLKILISRFWYLSAGKVGFGSGWNSFSFWGVRVLFNVSLADLAALTRQVGDVGRLGWI